MFGPHDNFNIQNGHVVPGLINKVVEVRGLKIKPSLPESITFKLSLNFGKDIVIVN